MNARPASPACVVAREGALPKLSNVASLPVSSGNELVRAKKRKATDLLVTSATLGKVHGPTTVQSDVQIPTDIVDVLAQGPAVDDGSFSLFDGMDFPPELPVLEPPAFTSLSISMLVAGILHQVRRESDETVYSSVAMERSIAEELRRALDTTLLQIQRVCMRMRTSDVTRGVVEIAVCPYDTKNSVPDLSVPCLPFYPLQPDELSLLRIQLGPFDSTYRT